MQQSQLSSVQLYDCLNYPNSSVCPASNYRLWVQYCASNPSSTFCGSGGTSSGSSSVSSGTSTSTVVTTTTTTATSSQSTSSTSGFTQYGGYSNTQYCGSQYSGTNYCSSCQSSPSSCSSFNYAAYVRYCNNDPTNKYCGGSGTSSSVTSNTPSNTVAGGLTQYGGYSNTQYCGPQYSGTNYCNSCQTSPSACSGFNYAAYVSYCNKDPTNTYCGGSGASSSGSGSSISITVPSTNSNNQQTGTTGDNFATTCNVNGQLSQYCAPYLSYQFDQFCGGGINSVYCNTQGALGFARYQYRNVCQAYPNLKYCQSYQGSGLLFNYCAYNNDQNNAYYTQCNNYLNSQSYPYDKLCYSSPGSYYCNPSGTQGFQDWQYAQYCGSNPSSQYCQTYISRSSNPYYQYTFCQNNPNSSACSSSTSQGQQQQLSDQYIKFCQGSSSQWCLPTPTAQGFQYYEYSLYCQGNPNSQFCQGYLDPSGYAGCAQTTQYCQTYLQSESYQYAQYCSQFGSSNYCSPFMSQQGYQLYMQNLHCQSDSGSQYCTQFSYASQQQYQYCSAYQGSNYCITCQANPSACAQWPFSKYYAFCANDPTNKFCHPA
ncbi:MAG: hypothetical protein KGH71_00615 [Candidatus Micrarchaeota archaeon]|nr:hypothetical protein [Candidatus Micrarchaeota archaeon]